MTSEIENALFAHCRQRQEFCVFECTLGFGGGGRVDCISTNSKGIIRCYEIKVTKSDFLSSHGHNFVGNFNYYVVPIELYKEIIIPDGIGCYVYNSNELICKRKAKKKEIQDNLYLYIIRSLFREYTKYRLQDNLDLVEYYKKKYNTSNNLFNKLSREFTTFKNNLYLFLGRKRFQEFLGMY